MENEIIVKYIRQENRSVALDDDKVIGECDYEINNNKWVITHTLVSEEYGGRGIAKGLVLAIIDEARKQNIKIIPVCSYAKKMLEKEEYKDILDF